MIYLINLLTFHFVINFFFFKEKITILKSICSNVFLKKKCRKLYLDIGRMNEVFLFVSFTLSAIAQPQTNDKKNNFYLPLCLVYPRMKRTEKKKYYKKSGLFFSWPVFAWRNFKCNYSWFLYRLVAKYNK